MVNSYNISSVLPPATHTLVTHRWSGLFLPTWTYTRWSGHLPVAGNAAASSTIWTWPSSTWPPPSSPGGPCHPWQLCRIRGYHRVYKYSPYLVNWDPSVVSLFCLMEADICTPKVHFWDLIKENKIVLLLVSSCNILVPINLHKLWGESMNSLDTCTWWYPAKKKRTNIIAVIPITLW